MYVYVATTNQIEAIFSPPQGGLKRNEIEHHKVIYPWILWFSGSNFAIETCLDEGTLVITLKAINQVKFQGSELRPSFCGFIGRHTIDQ